MSVQYKINERFQRRGVGLLNVTLSVSLCNESETCLSGFIGNEIDFTREPQSKYFLGSGEHTVFMNTHFRHERILVYFTEISPGLIRG